MPDHRGKLEIFTQSVLREADEDAREIKARLRTEHDEAIRQARRDLRAEASRWRETRSAELAAAEMRRVSARMAENKRKLLDYRESCAQTVFANIQERVRTFVASPDYAGHLRSLLRKAYAALGEPRRAELRLRKEDMGLWEELRDSLPETELTLQEGNFRLGGLNLACPERGMRADLSFDSALEDLVGHFSELSGMHMN